MNTEIKRVKDDEIIFSDPQRSKREKDQRLPDDARFACGYHLHLVVDIFTESVFLRRTETTDELWAAMGTPWFRPLSYGTASAKDFGPANLSYIGRAFAVKRKGSPRTACLRLIDLFFWYRFGEFPEDFIAPGIVDKASYEALLERQRKEREENRKKAQENEIELIRVARELGLNPRATGKYPDQWIARCPGKHHHIYITTTEKLWFCGYCGRKGEAEELRAFVKERKGGE